MPMKTAEQVAADVAVLLADVSSSGTGAPPCDGTQRFHLRSSCVQPSGRNGPGPEKLPFRVFLQSLSRGGLKPGS
ncbi:hypothetical protein QYE76_009114 [Lolium multiflorum]|uniref:Uncharacterized protein n=1 Tax=Lolium multiflorum TaxID=4521 RepID=A0AAD8X315_LOLMU|nr:hypothetical protein QYE76_009114 [Lolium multiflorum]